MKTKTVAKAMSISRQGRTFSAMVYVELHSAGPDEDPFGWAIAQAVAYTPAGEMNLTPSEIGLAIKDL